MRLDALTMLTIMFLTLCAGYWTPASADSIKDRVKADAKKAWTEIKKSKGTLKASGKQAKENVKQMGKEIKEGFKGAKKDLKKTFTKSDNQKNEAEKSVTAKKEGNSRKK